MICKEQEKAAISTGFSLRPVNTGSGGVFGYIFVLHLLT
jgi:hypothetical protein